MTETTFKVPYTTILNIAPHSNADKLEICTVYGFQVITRKGAYQVGDKIVYVPIDSILPQDLEDTLFPPDSKVKLHHHRVRQIKLRGLASQGMLIDLADTKLNKASLALETDLAPLLGITKYEPPIAGASYALGNSNKVKKSENPLFHKYNGVENIKWFPNLFKDGDLVVIQEKLHGTNARASILPYSANTFWKKIKKFLGLSPKVEKCYGSNNVEISAKFIKSSYYGEDLYGKVFKDIKAFDKIKEGEIIYGEIIGPGIQKNYTYGLKEHKFLLFDVKVLKNEELEYLNPNDVEAYASERGFDFVPVLYRGPYNKEFAYSLTKGSSIYNPNQKIREGIVIKDAVNYNQNGAKRALKFVSEDYLNDFTNTDNH